MKLYLRISGWFGVLAAVLLLGVFTTSMTSAGEYVSDGRLNADFHMGGSAIYCVDQNWIAGPTYVDGGIEVLGMDGQRELFVPYNNAIKDSDPPIPADVKLGDGSNKYGNLELWRAPDGKFTLTGFDEWGKQYFFEFYDCIPKLPNTDTNDGDTPGSNDHSGPDCPDIIIRPELDSASTLAVVIDKDCPPIDIK